MNDFKKKHLEKKNKIIDCLNTAEQFLIHHEYLHEAEMIAAQRENIEKGEFSIAVVGEFSAGKSTFLNALMGEKILPSFTKETTATINFLRHKEKAEHGESGIVFYNDGRQETLEDVDFATISKYVSTESIDVDVAKSVSHLDLFLSSKFLEDNVTLVDTPGLNGIAEGHRELTEEQIEKSSASIFLFDANQPGSRSDFAFLTTLRKRVKSILFVLNKIDSIKKSEHETVETVIDKLKENYKLVYPEAGTIPEIWPIAAYPALVARGSEKMDYRGKDTFTPDEKAEFEKLSGMKEFEDRLWRFLTQGEKAKSELLAPITQLIEQLKEIKNLRNIELDALSGAVDSNDIEMQQLELNRHLADLEEQLNAKTKNIKQDLRNAQREFFDAVIGECERSKKRFGDAVDNFVDLEDIDSKKIEKRINTELLKIGETAYQDYCDTVQAIQAMYSNKITDELNETLSQELNVKLDNKLDLPEYSIGLENFEKGMDELKAEIEKLRKEADEGEDDWERAMELNQKRETLENKLAAKIDAKDFFEENSMTCIPPVKIRTEQREVKIKREGVLGGIATFFVGNKRKIESVEVCDKSDRDEYLRNRNAILEKHDKEIAKYQEQLDNLTFADVKAAERIAHRRAEALSEKRAELATFQQNFADKVKKQGELQLKRQKTIINEYVDDLSEDFIKQCKENFKNNHKAQVNVIIELIGSSITKQIELKQKELELLNQQLDAAVSERNERISKINEELNEMKTILSTALDIETDINSIQIDVITEENL